MLSSLATSDDGLLLSTAPFERWFSSSLICESIGTAESDADMAALIERGDVSLDDTFFYAAI